MIDYTQLTDSDGRNVKVPIIKGSEWPSMDRDFCLRLENASGWDAAVTGWTYQLRFSRFRGGGSIDMTLTASAAAIEGNYLVLTFSASPANTNSLVCSGRAEYRVELRAVHDTTVSIIAEALGKAEVQLPRGGVS